MGLLKRDRRQIETNSSSDLYTHSHTGLSLITVRIRLNDKHKYIELKSHSDSPYGSHN